MMNNLVSNNQKNGSFLKMQDTEIIVEETSENDRNSITGNMQGDTVASNDQYDNDIN
jgi:hypothetical protein